jgi:hypothetical protein
MPNLQDTPELKQTREKVDSIAGGYKDYKNRIKDTFAGISRQDSDDVFTMASLRSNDYIRAHKKEIWDYRRAFAEAYIVQRHPQSIEILLQSEEEDLAQSKAGQQEELDKHTDESSEDGSMSSKSDDESDVYVNHDKDDKYPRNDSGEGAAAQAPAAESMVKRYAVMANLLKYDLNRFFMDNMKMMLKDYFRITIPRGSNAEDLTLLDKKQAQLGTFLGRTEKTEGPTAAMRDGLGEGSLSEGQKAGLSEIAKFLYQNCARRYFRQNMAFVEGLLLRPARERLLVYYLVEKGKYKSASESDVMASQIYTPNIDKFRDVIERRGYNFIGRAFLGSVHWSYLSKAAQAAMALRERLVFFAENGAFGSDGRALDGQAGIPREQNVQGEAHLPEPREEPGLEEPNREGSGGEHSEAGSSQGQARRNINLSGPSGRPRRRGAAARRRNQKMKSAVTLARSYMGIWKNSGYKLEDELNEEERRVLEEQAKELQKALQELVAADEAVAAENNAVGRDHQFDNDQEIPEESGDILDVVLTAGVGVGMVGVVGGLIALSEAHSETSGTSTATPAASPVGGIQPTTAVGSGEKIPESIIKPTTADTCCWRIVKLFPTIKDAGSGVAATLGAALALVAFVNNFRNEWPTIGQGTAAESAEFITTQIDKIITATKASLTDSVSIGNIFEGSVPEVALANLAKAVSAAGMVSGALGITMGSLKIHRGRRDRERLNTIKDWTAAKAETASDEEAADSEREEGHLIKVSQAVAARKAKRDIVGGSLHTAAGALSMVGGILSLTVAGAALGSVLMLLGTGIGLAPTVWAFFRKKRRQAELVDDYIDMPAIKRYLLSENLALPISDLEKEIREEVAGLMGFLSVGDLFDYICQKMASSLLEGMKKNMNKVRKGHRKHIAENAGELLKSGDLSAAEKEFANYVLMVESFGVRFNFRRDGTYTRPTLAQLRKAIGSI